MTRAWVAFLLLCAFAAARAQSLDINETLIRVPVSATAADGRSLRADIPVTLFRPDGPGPFPLVVISHGRAAEAARRAEPRIQRFEQAARFFVRKGFAVAVPTRMGYGETVAVGDPERYRGRCEDARYADAMNAGAAQVWTVVERLRAEPWVDPRRLVLVGQSVGGFVTVAAAASSAEGLVAAINFAGGAGGNPELRPGEPCASRNLARTYAQFGGTARAPMLWIYTENDLFFASAHSRAWHAAFVAAGGDARYLLLPPFQTDGHQLFARGNDLWQPLVDDFLRQFGFTRPGTLSVASTGFAALDDVARIPYLGSGEGWAGYRAFLAAKPPRAFAIGARGGWGWASGDDSLSRALANCQKHDVTRCRLYAVDDVVVWRDTSSP